MLPSEKTRGNMLEVEGFIAELTQDLENAPGNFAKQCELKSWRSHYFELYGLWFSQYFSEKLVVS